MIFKDFLDNGYRVFPLLDSKDHDGTPLDEKLAYKKPRSSGWQNTPLWSEDQIEFMEEVGQFDTGYGVLCSGLIVIDVDARNGGVEAFERLSEDVPEIAGAGLIVSTGSGGGSKHLYFKAPEGVPLVQHLDGYSGIDMKSTGYVVGPGSLHASGNHYKVLVGSPDDIDDAPDALIDLLRKPERHRAEYDGGFMDVSAQDVADMLSYVDPSVMDYDQWVSIGMAIHETLRGDGENIWHDWSARSPKHDDTHMETKWHSFGKASNPVTIGTIIHFAEQGGWKPSVTFEADYEQFTDTDTNDPLDTSSVDLKRPPGFVGDVTAWINDQCLFPRENLAVGAALLAMGNVIGLRYVDDLSSVTANLFTFGVAGSGTGKESIISAISEIHRVAGIAGATVGTIKSEQEVVRNLIAHQAALYVVDEFGITLGKIKNASRSGAAHLEGVVGMFMSAYSKANSFLLVSGDVKREMQKLLAQEIASLQKRIDNNEDKTGASAARMERAINQLETLDNGLEKPFLSLSGFTTPQTFDKLIDFDQATSGFLGRALLFTERSNNPQAKDSFSKRPMPDKMQRHLQALFHGGAYDAQNTRVENYSPRIPIETTPDAIEAMKQASDHFWNMAEDHLGSTGLEAIPRRSYELMSKVSLILAAPSGLRTAEHVRWAFALAVKDAETKITLVMSNDASKGADVQIMAHIMKYISTDHGETFNILKNKMRKYRPEDIQKALDHMASRGAVRSEETTHPKNGKVTVRYFAA